jgi:hypothetical protein
MTTPKAYFFQRTVSKELPSTVSETSNIKRQQPFQFDKRDLGNCAEPNTFTKTKRFKPATIIYSTLSPHKNQSSLTNGALPALRGSQSHARMTTPKAYFFQRTVSKELQSTVFKEFPGTVSQIGEHTKQFLP